MVNDSYLYNRNGLRINKDACKTTYRRITQNDLYISAKTMLSIGLQELCGNNFGKFNSRCYSGNK